MVLFIGGIVKEIRTLFIGVFYMDRIAEKTQKLIE